MARSAARKGDVGPRLLEQKLMQKKLPRDMVRELAQEAEDNTDPVEDAWSLVEKKLATSTMQKLDTATRKRRLWGMLARRGFDGETIRTVMDRVHGNDEEDGAE